MTPDKTTDDSNGGFEPREMVQGDWTCSDCGAKITELPFKPAADRPINCKECWSKKKDQGGPKRDFAPRKMFQGNWKCADCDTDITELPFEPREGTPIRCRECWMKQKNQ
jgi:CxxC-x17-CxxC domain-containing protein